ncbi:MAG TPA: acetyl-CoA carboxylase biotin carboxylase subunit [Candidatus Thermoplasmatota archaeon]|nr:acetyl-CoA carboxylase biotin carboxylase subunit [Candidatus Thermoplasmatota archaeon]
MFKKILIANRGEIAVRVIRACRELGVKTVAVYSEADANALHVHLADEKVFLGPGPSRESYLVIDKVIAACKQTGAEAVHPGYGFLSENAAFVERCEREGIKFIGPTSKAMHAMGDKVSAKKNAIAAGVPVAASSEGAVSDPEEARKIAEKIGLPVIIKAVHGGGGIGQRIVERMEELPSAIESCMAQALSSFGNSEVFIEKFIVNPRHIEYQILGDEHGHVIHLGERECSIQRRNQKLLEESPSVALTPEMRKEMGEKCVALAKRVGYSCAGTMEFLYSPGKDGKPGQFYFMEMNTRLQVEHPVTELVTGIDLVKWQIRVAAGEKLTVKQEDVVQRGHALECRINAENPYRGFAPSPGTVTRWITPGGPGVRVDSGCYEGFTIPQFYDSMVCKLITWAPTREENVRRMKRALQEFEMGGVEHNIPFHLKVVDEPRFQKGDMHIGYLREVPIIAELEKEREEHERVERLKAAAVAAVLSMAPGGVRAFAHAAPVVKGSGNGEQEASGWVMAARRAAVRRW